MTLLSRNRERLVSLAVFAALALGWEVMSWIYTAEAQPGEPMVAGWGTLFTHTFLSLSDYWPGGLGVPSVADGAPRSYLAALLSILSHSFATITRLASGLAAGRRRSASRSDWRFHGRPGAGGSSRYRPSFCAPCRCSQWCRCFSSGSGRIFSARCCSSPMASASSCSPESSMRCASCRRSIIDNARVARRFARPSLPNRHPARDPAGHALRRPAEPRRGLGRGSRSANISAHSRVSAISSFMLSNSVCSTGCS